ncbi:MAG TPA: hypothetical protein VJ647_02900 [Chitinophagaceae bacterium]|nr:hypothetical protein [Chitinophagaceae bacterium]
MQTWSVTVILDAFERRKNNSGLLHLFTGFLLILKTMDWVKKMPADKQWLSFLFLGAGFLFVLFGLWGRRLTASFTTWSKRLFIIEMLCFLALSLLFLPNGKPVDFTFTVAWTLLCCFFYYSEKRTEKPAVVKLTEQGILIPGMFKGKLLPWSQVESIVLRTDYLTINKKTNKYYQFEVAEENGESFIAEFNRYAAGKIK